MGYYRYLKTKFYTLAFSYPNIMCFRFIFIFLFVLTNSRSFSQILTSKQELIIKSDLRNFYNGNDTIVNSVILNKGLHNVTITPNDTFYNVDGYHFVYRLKNGSATRLDRSYFHGGNFNRFLFNHNGKLYLLGGYGMFTTNNNLEVFSEDLKEFNYIPTTGEAPQYILGLVLKSNDKIYVLKSIKAGNNAVEDEFDYNIYELDLKTFIWKKIKSVSPDFRNVYVQNYALKDYTVSIISTNLAIINNKTLEYVLFNKEESDIKAEYDLVQIDGNVLKLKMLDSSPSKKTTIKTFDIDKIWKQNTSKIKVIDLDPSIFQVYPKITLLLIISLVISALVMIAILYRNVHLRHKFKTLIKITNKPTVVNPLVESLKNHSNTILTIEELDDIFGISHMENESKKTKRHRLISQINTNIPNLITREKDELDKRKFVYRIDNLISDSDVTNM